MPKSEIAPEIQNVVVSATLGQEMDLNSILRIFPTTKYNPETFPGLIFRLKKPKATALIFRSGKMICAGAKSERQAKRAVSNILDELRRSGIVILGKPNVETQNIVATASLGGRVDLEKTAYALERTIYDPEQFPGLIYRMNEPKVVMLIFANGKLVCAGAKSEDDVYSSTTRLEETLQQKELISYAQRGKAP